MKAPQPFDDPDCEFDCDCARDAEARLVAEALDLRRLVEALGRVDFDLRDRTSLSVAVVKVLEAERMVLGALAHLDPTFAVFAPQLLEIAAHYRNRLLVELPSEVVPRLCETAGALVRGEEDLWRAVREGDRDGSFFRLGPYELPLTLPQARRLAADLRNRWPLPRRDLRAVFP